MSIIDIEQAKLQTHWTAKQRNHLRRCIQSGDYTFAYYNTDVHGYPANGGTCQNWRKPAYPGKVETLPYARPELCGPRALHATYEPHRWAGTRVWIVAFKGIVATQQDKIGGIHREIIGEVLPNESLSHSVGVRIGRKDLTYANLTYANLTGADLTYANLTYANLARADLTYANLTDANLARANLARANLTDANLARADLTYATLTGANLTYANLALADLTYANLTDANRPEGGIPGWKVNLYGRLERA